MRAILNLMFHIAGQSQDHRPQLLMRVEPKCNRNEVLRLTSLMPYRPIWGLLFFVLFVSIHKWRSALERCELTTGKMRKNNQCAHIRHSSPKCRSGNRPWQCVFCETPPPPPQLTHTHPVLPLNQSHSLKFWPTLPSGPDRRLLLYVV